ncbi:unnamed protein product, partial [Vitis vinifera]
MYTKSTNRIFTLQGLPFSYPLSIKVRFCSVSNLRSQSLDRLDPWCIWHRISLYFVTLSYLVQILLIFKICRALGFRGVQTLIRYKFLRVLVKMGLKRSFENEEFQELPFKNMKCVESRDKLASFGEIVPCKDAPQKPDISDECSFYKFQCGTEGVENGVSVLDDKGFEISAPLSCNGSSEEDGRSVAAAYSSLSPEYFESYLPRRTVAQFEDIYSSLLDCSPRRQVPVGPDHQANVPVWSLQKVKNRLDKLETSNRYISSSHPSMEEEDQKTKHVCKLCNKRYPSGKSLGGHMRSHMIGNSAEAAERKKISSLNGGRSSKKESGSQQENKPQEQQELAICLMMLSRDSGHWGGLNSLYDLSKRAKNDSYSEENVRKRSKYQCLTCNKTFHSHQALGGHRANHKRKLARFGSGKTPIAQDLSGKAEKKIGSRKSNGHMCPICFKVFRSGQALGGHKKSHFVGVCEDENSRTLVIKQEPLEIPGLIDLNLPAPIEEEANEHVGASILCRLCLYCSFKEQGLLVSLLVPFFNSIFYVFLSLCLTIEVFFSFSACFSC